MRYAFVAAGLAAVAYAGEKVVDTTVTYCDPTKTDCAYWGDATIKSTTTVDGGNGCSTTSTYTSCATWTRKDNGKVDSTCIPKETTVSVACKDGESKDPAHYWGDYTASTTSSSTSSSCGSKTTTTSTGTKCATWTRKDDGKIASTCVPTTTVVVKEDKNCDGHWDDWEEDPSTSSSSSKCGGTSTSTSTGTKCATWTRKDNGKVESTCVPTTTVVTTTAECTTTTTDGDHKTWGDWSSSSDSCGVTTKTETGCKTFTPVEGKTITKCSTTTFTTKPASCTSSSSSTKDAEDGDKTWSDYIKDPATTTKDGETTKDASAKDPAASTWADAELSSKISPVTLTSTAACGSYTGTGAPSWFANLPTDVGKSLAAKWTGGAPADWCYYTYSTNGAVKPTGASTVDADGASKTGAWAKYTGAANANTGSVAFAGLAALAAAILA